MIQKFTQSNSNRSSKFKVVENVMNGLLNELEAFMLIKITINSKGYLSNNLNASIHVSNSARCHHLIAVTLNLFKSPYAPREKHEIMNPKVNNIKVYFHPHYRRVPIHSLAPRTCSLRIPQHNPYPS